MALLWPRLRDGLPNTLLVTASTALSGLISGLILARTLGPEGRGQFATVLLWPTMSVVFSDLGLGFAFSYFAGKDRKSLSGLWTLAWVASLIIGGSVCLAGILILPSLLRLSGEALISLRWNMITVPIMMLTGYLGYLVLGAGYLVESNLVRACGAICYTLGIAGVAIVGRSSVIYFTIVFILAQFSGCVLAIVLCIFSLQPVWLWQSGLIKPVLSYGIRTHISSLAAQANLRFDQMIMTVITYPAQLGLYVVAVALSGMLNPLYSGLAIVVLPRVTQASSRLAGGKEAVRHLQLVFLGGIPLTMTLCIIMPWLLPLLFGHPYQLALCPAQVLLVGALFQGGVIVLGNSLRGLGYPGKTAISEGIGLLTTVILLFTLLPIWGILGAAVASLVAYGMVALVQTGFLVRVSGIKWSELFRFRTFYNFKISGR